MAFFLALSLEMKVDGDRAQLQVPHTIYVWQSVTCAVSDIKPEEKP